MKRVVAIFFCIVVILLPVAAAENMDIVFDYDDNGNLLQGINQYEYDELNQLSRVLDSEGNVLEEYFYSHEGDRVRKVEHLDNGLETTYYFGKELVRVVNDEGTFDTYYFYDEDGTLLYRKDPDGSKFYYHPDHLGSTTLVTNENGEVVEETSYLPFGDVLEGGNDRYTFTGQEKDATGLMYYGARFYDPLLRQFTQPDTVIQDVYDPQNLNRYAYVRNNPYKYVDPSGNVWWVPFVAFGVAAFSFAVMELSPVISQYVAFDIQQSVGAAYNEPSLTNFMWAGLAVWDGATPGIIPESRIGKGLAGIGGKVLRKGEAMLETFKRDPAFLRKSKVLQTTTDSGKDVFVSSYDEGHALLADAFPKYKKLAGNSPTPKNIQRKENLKAAEKYFEKSKQGWYKTDYQYANTGKIHPSGNHGKSPHINIYREDGVKVNIVIDKS